MTKGRIKACQNCSTLGDKALNGNLGQLAAISSFKLAQYNIKLNLLTRSIPPYFGLLREKMRTKFYYYQRSCRD